MTVKEAGLKARVQGIDAVRGLAILGMFAAHVGPQPTYGSFGEVQDEPWAWLWVFDGRAAATFAVLVGVSLTLLANGHSGAHSRARIATRAVLLILIGMILAEFQTPILVILVNTGLMMLIGMGALRAKTRTLVALTAAFLVIGPFARRWVVEMQDDGMYCPENTTCYTDTDGSMYGYEWQEPRSFPLILRAFWGFYPVLVWMAYVFAGMLVGRMALRSATVLARLGAVGAVLAALGYGGGLALGGDWSHFGNGPGTWWANVGPHSYSGFETLGNLGVTLVVIAGCCAIANASRYLLVPFAAVGAMALTAYSVHIVAVWAMDNQPVYTTSQAPLLWFWGLGIVGCMVWRYTLGRGPLERALHAASWRMAGADAQGSSKLDS